MIDQPPNTSPDLQLAPPAENEPVMKQLQPFDTQKAEVEKLKATAETLTVTDINDKRGMALARETRLGFKALRVAVTHRHKELKANILAEGNKLDADKRAMLEVIEPLEEKMQALEEFAVREAVRIEDENRDKRVAELAPYLSGPCAVDLGKITVAEYDGLLADMRGAHEARLAAAKKAEEDRIAQEQAEAAERERIRLENERLKVEAEEREAAASKEREEAAARFKAEQERAAEEAKVAEAKAAAEREAARAEREKLEQRMAEERAKAEAAQSAAAEKARKEREAVEAKAKAAREQAEAKAREERAAREKAERELFEQRDREEKAETARRETADKAAAAPDKVKLEAFAQTLRALTIPTLATSKAAEIRQLILAQVEKTALWVDKKAGEL